MSTKDTSGSTPQHSHPHNNAMSHNENFWVDQVTVPHPSPGERQGVGNDKGGGGTLPPLANSRVSARRSPGWGGETVAK